MTPFTAGPSRPVSRSSNRSSSGRRRGSSFSRRGTRSKSTSPGKCVRTASAVAPIAIKELIEITDRQVQRLTQLVESGGMIGFELGDLGELRRRLFESPQPCVGPTELITHRIDGAVDVLGHLQRLDGIGELVESQRRTSQKVITGGAVGFQVRHLRGVGEGFGGLVGQQVCVGQIEVDIWILRIEDE